LKKIQEMELEKNNILRNLNEMNNKLKITQELLAKEKIDNENSLFALKNILAQ